MKYSREIRVGVLAVVCVALLFFGLNFLKGINIFSPTKGYIGHFTQVSSLTEQSPVFIKGYKVGLVESIAYDFTRDTAFTVTVSIDKSIRLPQGTYMALAPNGLLGGNAIELLLPEYASLSSPGAYVEKGSTLPTVIVPGLMDGLQAGLLAHADSTLLAVNALVATLQREMESGDLHESLVHVERITRNLTAVSADLQRFSHSSLPTLSAKADSTLTGLQDVVNDIRASELRNVVNGVDSVVQSLQHALASDQGTVGALLNDTSAYFHLNRALRDLDAAILNIDTVVMSVKAHPCIKKRIPKQEK